MLIFTPNLEKVEEVGCGGMDGNQVLVRLGRRCGKLDDLEMLRPLSIC